MGFTQRRDRIIETEFGFANGLEEPGHQGEVQLDAGVTVATLAAIERQMLRLKPGFGSTTAVERREFVICHPDLRHVPVRLLLWTST
ncbi:bsl2352 [Bradyrhizobium diazoefficiens USDA 110]|uniref:Bsl2352 protein n=1 Tax=Bradyrhizobium diazoefficiens (strain JCM 10833 / BCRC 13528 / IAM 13628 / NBRC 14792 / USDA 110) TaxID=224911 RepID=Q89SP8_BRADU|nr:hypothetical protein CO678_31295 [Bradyrhizobium diazoefficiens]QBP21179.1 hypothetical protein Bdiaspc4_12040 [Bradyrhizobium diazoefficiens]BAC47617.1 bsl2352 [Bradyrhizobium diazoefficiens USDA 110]